MRYPLRVVVGLALCTAGLALFCLSLYSLIRVGTCASGGPYVSARPCPPGTVLKILGIPGSLLLLGAGAVIFASRGGKVSASIGLGVLLWSGLFLFGGLAALFSALGPAAPENGSALGAIIVAVVFIPMGVLPLLGLGGGRVAARSGVFGSQATPLVPAAVGSKPRFPSTPAPAPPRRGADVLGDKLEALEKLGELRASGALTEEEFQAQKRKLLG